MAQWLIWIQAIWHMFLKDFSENVNFEKKSEKKSADSNKSMKNYPAFKELKKVPIFVMSPPSIDLTLALGLLITINNICWSF